MRNPRYKKFDNDTAEHQRLEEVLRKALGAPTIKKVTPTPRLDSGSLLAITIDRYTSEG